MRWLWLGLAAFTALALFSWPYVYVYRLDRAIATQDMRALGELVDIESVRAGVRQQLAKRVDRTIGESGGTVLGWIREGVRQIGDRAIDIAIDLDWVYSTLRTRNQDAETADPSLLSDTSYAFYESYDQFLLRLGELGENPIHVRLRLQDWRWKVVGIFQ